MDISKLIESWNNYRKDLNIFHELMRFRVREVLLISSLYESFIIEQDGALSERIYGEYYRLNLSTAPRISCAYSKENALDLISEINFHLVIITVGLDYETPLQIAKEIKKYKPHLPVFFLAASNGALSNLETCNVEKYVDKIFVWNGYSQLFVGMIKHVEDMNNVDADTRTGLVRVILLVEDSVRYYSRILPLLYSVVLHQTQLLIEEQNVNEAQKILRMRARPKVILATNYEEAMRMYLQYEPYILTVISDVRFPKQGEPNIHAGIDFIEEVRKRNPDLPVVIQSSEEENRPLAYAMGAFFINKDSESLEGDLRDFLQENLGFGPFVFRNQKGEFVAQANDMQDFLHLLVEAPAESILYHAQRNHFSAWLMARGEIHFAKILRKKRVDEFNNPQELRQYILNMISDIRKWKNRGTISEFDEALFEDNNCAVRLSNSSIGGKGRGISFIRAIIEHLQLTQSLPKLHIGIPLTGYIGIEAFEQFLTQNELWDFAYYEGSYEDIRKRFLRAHLPSNLRSILRKFLAHCHKPLAVRSSGLFEDMIMIPFSGIYDTFLIPNNHPSFEERLRQLETAIKLVYASLFSPRARTYFDAAHYKIEEERMAVVVQEVVGTQVGRWFYPSFSGTAQSWNYYPVSYLKPEDGICLAAIGLGSYVVEGGAAWRFSPRYPQLDLVSPQSRLRDSQSWFYAIDMEQTQPDFSQESSLLTRVPIEEAASHPYFDWMVSTFDLENNRFVPGAKARGPKFVDFANIIKYNAISFAESMASILDICTQAMAVPVEIEYAVDLQHKQGPTFFLLQVKPLIRTEDKVDISLENIERANIFLSTNKAMGNGKRVLYDIVYVDPRYFDRAATEAMAQELAVWNAHLKAAQRRYILIGPGRFGTRDRWLGIPVHFDQISAAAVIVEADTAELQVESSLGSHFFHNITTMGIGYFSIPWHSSEAFIDWEWIYSLPVVQEGKYTRHCHVPEGFVILMDGRQSKALGLKQEFKDKNDGKDLENAMILEEG